MKIANISICIPSYNRSKELSPLLESIIAQNVAPREVVICEDVSPERDLIGRIIFEYRPRIEAKGSALIYSENERNLGYDGNLREVIGKASSDWVMFLGNDDLLKPDAVETMMNHILSFGDQPPMFHSRAYFRTDNSGVRVIGVSKLFDDVVAKSGSTSSKYIFRLSGFFSGLTVNKVWAERIATSEFDGGLFYQVFLAAEAYCNGGIGYVKTPIVAARTGNPPLFGAAANERSFHKAGSYSAKARSKMWDTVLKISETIGRKYAKNLDTDIRRELMIRQSFHVFEMNASAGRNATMAQVRELYANRLFYHPVPIFLAAVNIAFGRGALVFYKLARLLFQRA